MATYGQKNYRDRVFKYNEGAGYNFVQNQKDFINNKRKSVEEMWRL